VITLYCSIKYPALESGDVILLRPEVNSRIRTIPGLHRLWSFTGVKSLHGRPYSEGFEEVLEEF
jgi:hypothetical protein